MFPIVSKGRLVLPHSQPLHVGAGVGTIFCLPVLLPSDASPQFYMFWKNPDALRLRPPSLVLIVLVFYQTSKHHLLKIWSSELFFPITMLAIILNDVKIYVDVRDIPSGTQCRETGLVVCRLSWYFLSRGNSRTIDVSFFFFPKLLPKPSDLLAT